MAREEQTIPRKGVSEPNHEVCRPSESGPSSAPQTDVPNDDRPNTPPPYSGPTTPAMIVPSTPQIQPAYPGLPKLDYQLYSPQTFTLSSDQTTITSYQPRFSIYPIALVSLIQALATVPPKPQIRIVGGSPDGTIDFDVKVNLMNLIVPEDKKGRMNYIKLIGPGEIGFRGKIKETTAPTVTGGLEEWARIYCEDSSSIK